MENLKNSEIFEKIEHFLNKLKILEKVENFEKFEKS